MLPVTSPVRARPIRSPWMSWSSVRSRPLLDAKLADVGVEAPEIKRPSPVLEEKGA
jgi:hypothetical protein